VLDGSVLVAVANLEGFDAIIEAGDVESLSHVDGGSE